MLVITFLINSLIVTLAILIHYETLYQLERKLPHIHIPGRYRVLIGVAVIITAHVAEIWLFAIGYYFMLQWPEFGTLAGNFNYTLLDCSYFSFTTYTTLGFGDIEPSGYIRFLTGIESLIGLVLITWSASLLFLEMQRHWPKS